jgi:hypothetical protein
LLPRNVAPPFGAFGRRDSHEIIAEERTPRRTGCRPEEQTVAGIDHACVNQHLNSLGIDIPDLYLELGHLTL